MTLRTSFLKTCLAVIFKDAILECLGTYSDHSKNLFNLLFKATKNFPGLDFLYAKTFKKLCVIGIRTTQLEFLKMPNGHELVPCILGVEG